MKKLKKVQISKYESIVKKLESTCLNWFQDTSFNHNLPKYLEDYMCYVEYEFKEHYYDDGDDAVVFEVRAELDYDEFEDLIDKLDDTVEAYIGHDMFYFEMVEPGIATCWIPASEL